MHSVSGCKAKGVTRKRALQIAIKVKPTEVCFTQDTGFSTFSDKRWLAQTMYEIVRRKLDPQDLPLLRVCRSNDGRLWSLDNRRLYIFRECKIRSILVEPVELLDMEEDGDGDDDDNPTTKHKNDRINNLEYHSKRFGMTNGSKSDGQVLVIKEATQSGGKQGKASVAALMPCPDCGRSALVRYERLTFTKGKKKASIDDCDTCEQLVSWCKKI